MIPRERLDEFIYEVINCGDDEVLPQELACYKSLLKDLEVLNILKNKLTTDELLNLRFKNNTLSADDFNKIKAWLRND